LQGLVFYNEVLHLFRSAFLVNLGAKFNKVFLGRSELFRQFTLGAKVALKTAYIFKRNYRVNR